MATQTDWTNAYVRKAYDRINFVVPKGRRAELNAKLKADGKTLGGYLNTVLREYLGLSESEWGLSPKEPPR